MEGFGFFQRELETKFPDESAAFKARWESRGVSDRLIRKALKYVEDTSLGQVGFVVPPDISREERQRILDENYVRNLREGGIGDHWLMGLQRAFS